MKTYVFILGLPMKRILFSQVTSLVKSGQKKSLNLNDYPELTGLWDPRNYDERFNLLEGQKGGFHLLIQILKLLRPQGRKLLIMASLVLIFKMTSPILIHGLIKSVSLSAAEQSLSAYGIWMALSLGAVQLISAIIGQHYMFHSITSTQSAVNGINQRIFNAVIAKGGQQDRGQLMNRVSADSELAGAILWASGELFQIVMTLILTSALLFYYLGSIALIPLSILSVLVPVSKLFSRQFARIHEQIMKRKDLRVSKMAGFLEGIKIVKSFIWEKAVRSEITNVRSEEVGFWRRLSLIKSLSTGSYLLANLLVSFISFAVFTYQGNELTPELAFTCVMLFSFLEPCFRQLPKILGDMSSSLVAAQRISEILGEKKKDQEQEKDRIILKNVCVSIDDKEILHHINLDIKQGESVAIVGGVGAGKTSLLNTLNGDYEISSGQMIQGYRKTALVTQDPFLFLGNIAENISLSTDWDDQKLHKAIESSCLRTDLDLLPGKHLFELIENGSNLSGGQRQRVNLARAAYHEADLILLDDPLSALDPHTEDLIVSNLLMNYWQGKTRIVTTQRLKHLNQFDKIIFMADGEITGVGSFSELLNTHDKFREFVSLSTDQLKSIPASEESVIVEKGLSTDQAATSAIGKEEYQRGEISLSLYVDYLKAMAKFSPKEYAITIFGLLGVSILAMLIPILQNKFLSLWSNSQESFYLFSYGLVGLGAVVVGFCQHFYWSNKAITAGQVLHDRALNGVLATSMRYFDFNPSGRILNRFSRDLDAVEKDLSWSLEEAFMALLNSVGAVIVMLLAIPLMGVIILPVLMIYGKLQKSYRRSMREAKRLMATSRSPRFSSVQEIAAGASVIRTYGAEQFFRTRFVSTLADYQRAFFGVVLINRWFSVRIPVISSLLSFSAAIGVIVLGSKGHIGSALAGMTLVYAFRFWDGLNWTVRAFGEAESQMTSVERLNELAQLDKENKVEAGPMIAKGEIVFNNVFARYDQNLPDVLKGTSFSIASGEKVGVIGRTGAGKSTLFSLLHGFIPFHKGQITIDDAPISDFSLNELRGSISTIPQNPVLFAGTIRSNLDPYRSLNDTELEEALKMSRVDFLRNGLDTVVLEGGLNFSKGQRQLLCLARALVRKAKIIIVDEATASIDAKTDSLIRDILMNECPQITVLIIAHKMKSISECDKIIEMGEGRVLTIHQKEEFLQRLSA